jgi:hypothetical protein
MPAKRRLQSRAETKVAAIPSASSVGSLRFDFQDFPSQTCCPSLVLAGPIQRAPARWLIMSLQYQRAG